MLVSAYEVSCNVCICRDISLCRNPVATNRPAFRDILLTLLGSQEEVLSIPPEALDVHYLAGLLGSPLDVGQEMYLDMQYRYV